MCSKLRFIDCKVLISIESPPSSKSADHLIEESGCVLEHPSATKFRQHVMNGDWIKADHYLQELQLMIERKQSNIAVIDNFYIILFL